ncbi:MAG: transposase [Thermoanaerobaculia bacterium]|nr:transposase [Thermoanaerobaculia bacterium]
MRQPLCADIDGFSLHAAVRVGAHDRKRLEQLCRYITRPALSDERVQLNAAGQVELKLKTPWRDGTTHLVLSPLEFMQRLAALVPRPRLHLIRFHGVLAPNAKLRPIVVPKAPEVALQATEAAATAGCGSETAQARPHPVARSARQVQLPTTASRQAIFAVGCRLGVGSCRPRDSGPVVHEVRPHWGSGRVS